MKKLILFIVLILGFINENKAQIAASSEIYYYVNTDANKRYGASGGLFVYCYKFYSDRLAVSGFIINTLNELNDLNNRKLEDVYLYNEELSNHKYFVYSQVRRQGWGVSSISYEAISKNREEIIAWSINYEDYRAYFKRVTINEIKTLLKPQFDFLE